ncbi:MAG: MBL fold metallo-hydrolase [Proteobacteria bacterium]|nr:MBL fold metallo-hydrolase [Pseudomonadota bacterium]
MNVKQFRYSSDNLAYVIYGKESAAAVDGGAVDDILSFVEKSGLTLKYVSNTHSHYDHIIGNKDLLKRSGARFLDNQTLRNNGFFDVDGENVFVYHTPGHMDDCVIFKAGDTLITGDTLFIGTVGNCFSGDLKGFYESIKLISTFPPETTIYPGHDYVRESLVYARSIEPDNKDILRFLEKYDPSHVFSTLADEMKINFYLRFNDDRIINMLQQKGVPVGTEYERWLGLMKEF